MDALVEANSTETPAKPKETTKPRRISRKVREACELLADGTAKTITGAAEQVGLTREHLSKQLKKEHVQTYLTREAKRRVSSAVLRAANVKVDLLEAESERVRSDVASELLAIQGIKAPSDKGGVSVNVNVQPGYVIDLSSGQTIEGQATEVGPTDTHSDDQGQETQE